MRFLEKDPARRPRNGSEVYEAVIGGHFKMPLAASPAPKSEPMPPRPFENQTRPPCDKGKIARNGGCWFQIVNALRAPKAHLSKMAGATRLISMGSRCL